MKKIILALIGLVFGGVAYADSCQQLMSAFAPAQQQALCTGFVAAASPTPIASGSLTISAGDVVISTAYKNVVNNIGTIAATGSTGGDGNTVANTVTVVTGADGTKGVKLPALSSVTAGAKIVVINGATGATLKVYANGTSDAINGATGQTTISVAAKLLFECWKYDSTNWYCSKGVTSY